MNTLRSVLATATSVFIAIYCLCRLVYHVSGFLIRNEHVVLCGDSTWAMSLQSDCFREGFLWPALLLLTSGLASFALALCLVLPPSPTSRFVSDGDAPLARMAIGDKKTPVRRPPGSVTLIDNRLFLGSCINVVLVIQAALYAVWWHKSISADTHNAKDSLYTAALVESTAMILLASAIHLSALWRSNRMVYAGLFPWVLPVLVGVQLTLGIVEIYVSFFTDSNLRVPMFGLNASIRSNLLVCSGASSAVLIVLFSCVQKRPIFIRSAASSETDTFSSSHTLLDNGSDDADDNEATPLSHPNECKSNALVDTPEFRSSWFDRLFFSWSNHLFREGIRRQLQYADIYKLDHVDIPVTNWKHYLRHRKTDRSLLKTMIITFTPELLKQIALAIVKAVTQYAGPFFLGRIIRAIELSNNNLSLSTKMSIRKAYLDAFGMLFCTLIGSLFENYGRWIGGHIGFRFKGIMVAELSAKTLCRSKNNSSDLEGNAAGASNQKSSVATDGKIMNLLTADLERLSKLCKYLDQIFSYSLSLGIGVWYMYQLLGVSALFGLSLTAVYIPLSKLMLARLAYSEKMVNVVSDKRISMITELVQGIKTVKLFGWEAHFLKNINNQREYQLIYLWKNALWRLFIKAIVMLGPMLIIIVMFATHVAVLGKELTAEIAFTTISVYQLVRFIFENFPTYVSLGINGYVSIGRIDSYLGQSEIQELEERVIQGPVVALGFQSADLEWESTEDSTDFSKDDTYGLPGTAFASLSEARTEIGTPGVENVDCNHQLNENTPLLMESFSCSDVGLFSSSSKATLSHNVNMDGFSLKNIDVQFPIGGFTIVAGPTGSGKSSLLSALIGEMALTRGHILLPTAYSSDAAASESKYRDIVELSNEGLAIRDIAYVAQESWLRNATIRENILFGEVYEKERYEEVLRVCALKPDLRILAAGDMTEIGERGIALSGGQKQRISLARAVYSSHRILLIDDCLSAVDSHTAKHILMECLVGNTSLIQGRTRVLVTHHVAMCLPYVNYMVMMHEGRITLKGAPSDLQSQGSLSMVLADLESSESDIVSHKGKNAIEKQATKVCRGKYFEGISDDSEDADQDDDAVEKDKLANSVNNTKSEDEYNAERLCKINAQRGLGPSSDISALQGTIVKEEEREEGYVKFEVWKAYLSACGHKTFWITILLMMVSWQGLVILHDYWIRIWVTSTSDHRADASIASVHGSFNMLSAMIPLYSFGSVHMPASYFTAPAPGLYADGTISTGAAATDRVNAQHIKHHTTAYWLGIYILIGIISVAWSTIQTYIVNCGLVHASRVIHSQLLQTIVHATPRFFDSTPFGRIINRFSRDMQIIDEGTLDTIIAWFADVFAVLGVFVIATMAIPVFIFVALAVLLIYTVIAYYYLNASREIKRLESNSMSPLLSLFGELLEGVSTIRAFGVKKYYIKEAINRIETHNRLFHTLWLTIRWLTARIHIASSIVSFTCALLIIMSRDWMDAGLAGFVLSYALSFSRRMIWVVLNYSNNEINMNAVERVIQYLDVEQEAAMESDPENKPFALWPRKGDVRIENLVVEYAPGVPVLHDISLSVKHGEKIGVVGRTGAGKSTMSLALLRFIEASKGRIILDDVDISKIGLEDLRRNVTIIPQDPVLFNGTIRFNLDPFGEHPDELLWDALKRTHLVRERESQTNNTTASIIEDIGGADGDLLMLECMTGIFISLDAEIKENGQILSLGQRQLVALARALVRRSKLIIMDEATASVDFDTDDRIQRTIRGPEFANSTLFCIAHRLRTIIDYDRILVLDKGKVAEFDTPHNLLQNENGIFRSMCEKSGEYEHLSIAAASGY